MTSKVFTRGGYEYKIELTLHYTDRSNGNYIAIMVFQREVGKTKWRYLVNQFNTTFDNQIPMERQLFEHNIQRQVRSVIPKDWINETLLELSKEILRLKVIYTHKI